MYFIETIIDTVCNSDGIGTIFHDAEDAMKVALWAILDIANDEADIRTEMDVTVAVKDLNGDSIFNVRIQAERLRSKIMAKVPVVPGAPIPECHLPT